MDEFDAGPGQCVITYRSVDTGGEVPWVAFARDIAADAARRAADGWRILSMTTFPTRQMGTTGNIMFQSGGQYATELGTIVVYSRPA